jgi:hypothetical protein
MKAYIQVFYPTLERDEKKHEKNTRKKTTEYLHITYRLFFWTLNSAGVYSSYVPLIPQNLPSKEASAITAWDNAHSTPFILPPKIAG